VPSMVVLGGELGSLTGGWADYGRWRVGGVVDNFAVRGNRVLVAGGGLGGM